MNKHNIKMKPNFVYENNKLFYRKGNQRYSANIYKCHKCKIKFPKIIASIKKTQKIYCSKECANSVNNVKNGIKKRGNKNCNWKGGRKNNGQGYILKYAPNHPKCDSHRCVLEHRLVMENFIGRLLYKDETVHHKNGIRDDNRIENLELRSGFHPQGQSPKDLLIWAKEILKRYDHENYK